MRPVTRSPLRSYDYVKRYYGVSPVVGARVRHTELTGPESFGTIAQPGSAGHYVYVRFDGRKHADPCHPTSLDYDPQEVAEPVEDDEHG